ncbi:MAG: DUF3343 domain-containing protein [Dehalococcoidales bacterium]|nr:DUF3343 domain-containing protein [Dehalococcoidales bacterium]MDD5604753.1 DUF3343 domain-containing protein [Dehalococcoidales bacterium]NLE89634.1 DUF3343 domain-containing protein [Dehalococcoidales bacterium]
MTKEVEKEKALVVFDYIYYAMRGKHFLEHAGYSSNEVAPPPEYRTGCDMALEINADDVDAVERILENNNILFMDILFLPKGTQLVPVYLTQLIKVTDYAGYTMVRCGNMKVTYRKGTGVIVNISGGG